MPKTGRLGNILRYYLPMLGGILLVVISLLLVGAKFYLSSSAAAERVSNRLEVVLGMPVKIGSADIGVGGNSSLHNVAGYETDGRSPDQPWITVQRIQADVSALDLLGDAKPQQVTLSGVHIDLCFDQAGTLLTKLPRPAGDKDYFPQIHIEEGQMTIAQEGRTPMVVTGITGDASGKDGRLTLTGTIADPYWKDWNVKATFDRATGAVVLNLGTPRAQVTREKLERMPFIPASVWRNVMAEGVTPVDFTLRFNIDRTGVQYRVKLTPEDTHVVVPSINLDANRAKGKVVVEDGLVELREVRGRFVDGDIILPKADLDFRKQPPLMTFDVGVKDLQLDQLREVWPIPVPEKFKGQVSGHADLNVTVRDGKAHTSGKGAGVMSTQLLIRRVHFDLLLLADEDGFHFKQGK